MYAQIVLKSYRSAELMPDGFSSVIRGLVVNATVYGVEQV
jgi:hypothetical protein